MQEIVPAIVEAAATTTHTQTDDAESLSSRASYFNVSHSNYQLLS